MKTYHRYEYIAVYDTDEVIVPRGHTNWTGLMADLTLRGRPDSWFFRNVYFFQDSLGLARAEDVEAADVPKGGCYKVRIQKFELGKFICGHLFNFSVFEHLQ